ncbi:putative DNA-binding transcriptional regulator [Escherichia coli P0298942.15]|nr:putative DNA-binding transcriptional regulator [Escherichia coli P0298942.15]
MGKHHWKVEKQPEWYVKAIRKTIAALPGGYAEAADWLDVTENALFNRPMAISFFRWDGQWFYSVRLVLTTLRMLSHSLLVGGLYHFLKLRK